MDEESKEINKRAYLHVLEKVVVQDEKQARKRKAKNTPTAEQIYRFSGGVKSDISKCVWLVAPVSSFQYPMNNAVAIG